MYWQLFLLLGFKTSYLFGSNYRTSINELCDFKEIRKHNLYDMKKPCELLLSLQCNWVGSIINNIQLEYLIVTCK